MRRITIAAVAVLAALLLAGVASACPTCKDSLANYEKAQANQQVSTKRFPEEYD